jgi:predicted amidohydrolase
MNIRIGLSQMNSGDNKAENLRSAKNSINELAGKGADLIILPEYFNFLGPEQLMQENGESIDASPSLDMVRAEAQRLKVYIHIGSYLEREDKLTYNTGVVFDPSGEIIAKYRKIHLFYVEIPGGRKYLESETITPGNTVTTFSIGEFVFGMATCYDLRFPELFRRLSDMGVHVFLLPAAFTLQTGRDHWELLLRARAVENLCWVAAAGQWGSFPPDNTSFGRSMVVNPWGIVVAQAPDGVSTITAEVDLPTLKTIRTAFPALDHMRKNIFQL